MGFGEVFRAGVRELIRSVAGVKCLCLSVSLWRLLTNDFRGFTNYTHVLTSIGICGALVSHKAMLFLVHTESDTSYGPFHIVHFVGKLDFSSP